MGTAPLHLGKVNKENSGIVIQCGIAFSVLFHFMPPAAYQYMFLIYTNN